MGSVFVKNEAKPMAWLPYSQRCLLYKLEKRHREPPQRPLYGIRLLWYFLLALFLSRTLFFGFLSLFGLFGLGNDVDGDLWLQLRRHLHRNGIAANRTDGAGQIDQAAINGQSLGIAQASGEILAGDRAIEPALPTYARFKGQRYLRQALGQPILLSGQLLLLALLSGYLLFVIRQQGRSSSSGQTATQQIIARVAIGHFL